MQNHIFIHIAIFFLQIGLVILRGPFYIYLDRSCIGFLKCVNILCLENVKFKIAVLNVTSTLCYIQFLFLRRRQYDPEIIEKTIGLVLGPFTALYRSFLKRCTLTNKAVGTIWRALSKPPQRRQGPDPRPLWLLVVTPSAFGPELAYRLRVVQPTLMDFPIFLYTFTLLYMSVYLIFMTSPLWLAVGPQSL